MGSGALLMCASLGPPESITQTASPSVKPFLHSSRQCRQACPGISFPLKIAPSHRGSGPYLIHAFFGPYMSITQMASRSVQPFLHSLQQNVITDIGACPSPSKLPLPMGIWTTIWHMVPWIHPTQHPKWHLDRVSHLCTAHGRQSLYLQWAPFPHQNCPFPRGFMTPI